MNFNPIDHASELMKAKGIKTQLLIEPYDDIELIDEMLRHQLYGNFDYGVIPHKLESAIRENTLYFTSDQFETHYVILRLPNTQKKKNAFFVIGPYLTQDYQRIIDTVIKKTQWELSLVSELKEYYSGIPCIPTTDVFSAEVIVLAKYIFGSNNFETEHAADHFFSTETEPELKSEQDNSLSASMIEERYRCEEAMLEAVEQGNDKKAMVHLSTLEKYKFEPRCSDSLRSYKNFFIVINTLFRKAVQRAAVHPAHIHTISDEFARRIEFSRNTEELSKLLGEMLRKYCLLVKNHSLRGYSYSIQEAVNYIDFNYAEQVNLSILSKVTSVNYSYLSTQFKKEVGSSIIDYTNQRRVQQARKLLVTTSLPINEISETVGFLDENYFSRTFKRHTGQSPSEYRKFFR